MRLVGRVPGISTIRDISQQGRVLMTNESARLGILARGPEEPKERELSWLGLLPRDGHLGPMAARSSSRSREREAVRRTPRTCGASTARRRSGIGDGSTEAFSPDGAWAIAITHTATPQIHLLPTGVGEPRALSHDGLDVFNADFLPDAKNVIFTAAEAGRGTRMYVRDAAGTAKARAISPEGYSLYRGTVTPDGKSIVVSGPDQRIYLYSVQGGEPTALPGLTSKYRPMRWSPDGRSLYVQDANLLPMEVSRYDVASGRLELWKQVAPADAAGLAGASRFVITPDARYYAYSYLRVLSYLQLVEGLK